MASRKRKLSHEERAELDARYEETMRKLQERLAYHEAKLKQERPAKRGA